MNETDRLRAIIEDRDAEILQLKASLPAYHKEAESARNGWKTAEQAAFAWQHKCNEMRAKVERVSRLLVVLPPDEIDGRTLEWFAENVLINAGYAEFCNRLRSYAALARMVQDGLEPDQEQWQAVLRSLRPTDCVE